MPGPPGRWRQLACESSNPTQVPYVMGMGYPPFSNVTVSTGVPVGSLNEVYKPSSFTISAFISATLVAAGNAPGSVVSK